MPGIPVKQTLKRIEPRGAVGEIGDHALLRTLFSQANDLIIVIIAGKLNGNGAHIVNRV